MRRHRLWFRFPFPSDVKRLSCGTASRRNLQLSRYLLMIRTTLRVPGSIT
jgi:hypothetical protein